MRFILASTDARRDRVVELYDSLFRFWGAGLFVLFGLMVLRDYGLRLPAVFGAVSSFSGGAYLLISQPGSFENWGWGFYVLAPIATAAPASAWVFSLSQFQDDFKLGARHIAVLISYAVVWYLAIGDTIRPDAAEIFSFEFAGSAFRIAMLGHMVFVAWRGRANDLLESRRRFRMLVVVLTTGLTSAVVIVETWFQEMRLLPDVAFVQAIAFCLFAAALVWAGLRVVPGILIIGEQAEGAGAQPKRKIDDPNERHDLQTITRLVEDGKIFLEPNLTISVLAEKAGLPEHRLRQLINQHLGYRNFSDFLNQYRIDEAKVRLADPESRRTQVLVIAMDLGYGSLGPFNRAFKERTGQTPTEFRRQMLADSE